jgi:hypothetical protein
VAGKWGAARWMAEWMEPFARTIDAAKKYVVSNTLAQVDWNAELVRGDLAKSVEHLKRAAGAGRGLLVGGVKLPLALAELGGSTSRVTESIDQAPADAAESD